MARLPLTNRPYILSFSSDEKVWISNLKANRNSLYTAVLDPTGDSMAYWSLISIYGFWNDFQLADIVRHIKLGEQNAVRFGDPSGKSERRVLQTMETSSQDNV